MTTEHTRSRVERLLIQAREESLGFPSKDWEKVRTLVQQVLSLSPDNAKAQFFLDMSELADHDVSNRTLHALIRSSYTSIEQVRMASDE